MLTVTSVEDRGSSLKYTKNLLNEKLPKENPVRFKTVTQLPSMKCGENKRRLENKYAPAFVRLWC